MTDLPIDIAALVGDDEDELVFGEAVAPPAVAETDKAPVAKKARRAPKKGSEASVDTGEAHAAAPSAAPAQAAAAEPADAPAPDPRPGDASAGSSVSEAPAPALAPVKDRRAMLMGAMVVLSTVTSFASLGGLIAVGRSLATLDAERAKASDQAQALARIAPLVHALDEASTRLTAAAARAPTGTPATLDDLHHAVDDMKLALSGRPSGGDMVTATMQGGFVQLDEHLARIERSLDGQRPRVVVTPVHGGGR